MQNKIEQMYTTGEYLKNNPTWDSGDAVWKSAQLYESQLLRMLFPRQRRMLKKRIKTSLSLSL